MASECGVHKRRADRLKENRLKETRAFRKEVAVALKRFEIQKTFATFEKAIIVERIKKFAEAKKKKEIEESEAKKMVAEAKEKEVAEFGTLFGTRGTADI